MDVSDVRVLLVDDDRSIVTLLDEFFEVYAPNWEVVVETDPQRALNLVERPDAAFDCIVSDYQMPVIDGLDLLSAARTNVPEIPFLIYTAVEPEQVREAIHAHQPTEILRKSVSTDAFSSLVELAMVAISEFRGCAGVAR